MVEIKGSVRDFVWTPEFNMKHLKKAEGHYYLEYSDYWPHLYGYTHSVSADMSFCEYNNKDEVNSPNILNNNDYQVLSEI